MGRKKKEDNKDEVVVLEKIEKTKSSSGVSEVFYYLLGLVIGIVLIFATEELLSTINFLFVVIFAIIAVVQLIGFIMDKKYISRDYSSLIIGIMCIWVAMFVFKYGSFLFLEMLPVLVSLLLFIMATSSITKYFDRKITGNLIVSIISIILGILLIFVPKSIMYTLFKVVGVYIIVMIILDFIDYKKNNKSA
ncbi:MAG TPA: hypothetical protein DHV54_02760 [Firmicutes bacterium]|jgi:membrane protein|nr:hypothetical protein [Bacillota bacterium]